MGNLLKESENIIAAFKSDETKAGAEKLLQLLIEAHVIKNLFLNTYGLTDDKFDELVKIEKRRLGLRLLDESTIEFENFKV